MIYIETKAYVIRMLYDIVLFYILFFTVAEHVDGKRKILTILIFLPLTFFIEMFTGFADLITIVGTYFLLKSKNKSDFTLLNTLILSILVIYSASMISSIMLDLFFSQDGIKGYAYVFTQLSFKILLLLTFVSLYKKFQLHSFMERYSSRTTSILMIYLFSVALLIAYAAHYYKVFDEFILGVISFLIIQTLFVLFLFIRITSKQKEQYERQIEKQELFHLKKYTDQLEQDQEQLAHFKHDYRNLLLSITESAYLTQNQELTEQVQQLEKYSNRYISTKNFDYKHFKNIKNSYLKSLIISKFYLGKEHKVHCHFECLEIIEKVPIPIFECIRILGIVLDNAIEAAKECKQCTLTLMIHQDDQQMEFLVENSSQELDIPINNLIKKGVSTKENHQGLGLNVIQEINKKNKNMFVQYKKNQTNFSTQIILMWDRCD